MIASVSVDDLTVEGDSVVVSNDSPGNCTGVDLNVGIKVGTMTGVAAIVTNIGAGDCAVVDLDGAGNVGTIAGEAVIISNVGPGDCTGVTLEEGGKADAVTGDVVIVLNVGGGDCSGMVIVGNEGVLIGENVASLKVGAGDRTDVGVAVVAVGKLGAVIGKRVGDNLAALVGGIVSFNVGGSVICGAFVGSEVYPSFLDFFEALGLELLIFFELSETFDLSSLPSIRFRINDKLHGTSQRNKCRAIEFKACEEGREMAISSYFCDENEM